jgi:hypothetical protein
VKIQQDKEQKKYEHEPLANQPQRGVDHDVRRDNEEQAANDRLERNGQHTKLTQLQKNRC